MRTGLSAVIVRLAGRNTLRRKGEALLVVLGSLLGTAIITSSFVVGDTLHATIRDQARTRLGPIDEVASYTISPSLEPAYESVTSQPLPDTDGVLREATASVTVTAQTTGRTAHLAEPDAFAQELDFDAGREFGGRPADTGLADAGPTPTGDQAVLGVDLASALHVGPGDRIGLFAYGQMPRADSSQRRAPSRRRRFPSELREPCLERVRRARHPRVAGRHRAAGAVLPDRDRCSFRTTGGVFDSTGPSDAVVLELQIRTAGLGPVEVTDEKQQTLEFADRQGDNFSRLFGLIGSFTVIAGVLLLINTFVMLAEDRKSEMGTLRALGFTRRHLVRLFGFEGTAYSLVAAASACGRHRCRCGRRQGDGGHLRPGTARHRRAEVRRHAREPARGLLDRPCDRTRHGLGHERSHQSPQHHPCHTRHTGTTAADEHRSSATRRRRCRPRRGDVRRSASSATNRSPHCSARRWRRCASCRCSRRGVAASGDLPADPRVARAMPSSRSGSCPRCSTTATSRSSSCKGSCSSCRVSSSSWRTTIGSGGSASVWPTPGADWPSVSAW